MTDTKESPGERARAEAWRTAWEETREEIEAGGTPGDVDWVWHNGERQWHLRGNAEEDVWTPVYPDEYFTHPEANRTGPRGDRELVSILVASTMAGAPPARRNRPLIHDQLHEAHGEALRGSAWRQIVPCLRKEEWLGLIDEEGLSWRRAAEILRTVEIEFGKLTLPVNDHAAWPDSQIGRPSQGITIVGN